MMSSMNGIVKRVSVSTTGMPKHALLQAMVTPGGVEGDKQRVKKIHGGPDRAVCLYSEELYQWLRDNHVQVFAGDLGENITTCGFDLLSLRVGDRVSIGQCEIQITAVREPCSQLKKWSPRFPELILGRSGWVARVTKSAVVRTGDLIEVLTPA
jgi:MOSC domain-containing protein YiiM